VDGTFLFSLSVFSPVSQGTSLSIYAINAKCMSCNGANLDAFIKNDEL
jgi:hypothetical protein